MPLSSGTRLGPYEVLSPIGAGGMGEVYRAKDTRLDRIVAIKVLAAHVADRPESRQRFEREARAVSSLNHPHICSLYDIGQQDGRDYLVMEYLEGETLAARLTKSPLPLDQVLRYAIQMADALSLAHQQSVFHRDLKPGNIMLTKSGAKLLDFGLAKLGLPDKGGLASALTAVPVRESTLTSEGMILGTVQYMAPEQLEGKTIDGRTDIFSLGAVLYEAITGRKAFDGRTPASVIAAILSSEPPSISTIPIAASGAVPGRLPGLALDRVVRKCLAKNPDDRWQTARDLGSEMQWLTEVGHLPEPEGAVTIPAGLGKRERIAWGVAALSVLVAFMLAFAYLRLPPSQSRPVRLSLSPPGGTSLVGQIAVSPDGKQLAFAAATPEGRSSLWVRSFESL